MPGVQRSEYADEGMQSGQYVDHCDSDPIGLAVLGSGETHKATHSLNEKVESRHAGTVAGPSEACDRAVHRTGIALQYRGAIEAERFHHSRSEVLNHDVGSISQATRQLGVSGV